MDRRGYLMLTILCAALFLGRLGAASLWDIDETSNARAAVEMMESGDYIVPTLGGELRTDKPPLHYWAMSAAYRVFGTGEFGARFFAGVFGLLAVLLTSAAGNRALGAPAGTTAGLLLAVSFLFTVSSRSATTDAFLLFFTNAAVMAGFFAREKRIMGLLCWAAMGFAVLAKGPVGVVLPAGALGLYFLVRTRSIRGLRPLIDPAGILLFLAIAVPWYGLAAVRTGGDLVTGFFLKHNVERFLEPMESHRGPFFYYLVILLPAFYPWAAFLPQSLAAAVRRRRDPDDGAAFTFLLIVWAGLVILFFSLASTKLPTYILPAFPALALLAAAWAHRTPDPAIGGKGLTASWIVTAVTGLVWPLLFGAVFALRMPDLLPSVLLTVPLALAAVPGIVLHTRGTGPVRALRTTAAAAAAGLALIHMVLVPMIEPYRLAPTVGRAVAERAGDEDRVARLGYFRPSLLYYGGRQLERLSLQGVAAFVTQPDARFLVTTKRHFRELPAELKDRFRVLVEGRDAADSNEVVMLLERANDPARGRREKAGEAAGLGPILRRTARRPGSGGHVAVPGTASLSSAPAVLK